MHRGSKLLVVLTACGILSSSMVLAAPPSQPGLSRPGESKPADKGLFGASKDRFALLVGINDYKNDDEVSDLSGCENDVDDMRALLTKTFKFASDEEHIRVLKSAQATKDGIIAAFKSQLIENAKKHPNGIFLFYYSGHGSRTPDRNGDEADGWDETLVPHDSRTDANHFDLIDDEIEKLFDELSTYTANITFILDSCHSGTATRNIGMQSRRAKEDMRTPPAVASAPQSRGKAQEDMGNAMLPRNKKYVAISGCAPNEVSNEAEQPTKDGTGTRRNGALTRNLINILSDATSEMTYRELWESVSKAVEAGGFGQHPQVEGDVHRFVLGGSAKREDPFIKVASIAPDLSSMSLRAGAAQGLRDGGLIAVYDPQTTTLKGTKGLWCTAKLGSVGKFSAQADLSKGSLPKSVTPEALLKGKVVLVTPNFGSNPLKVVVDSRTPAGKSKDPYARFVTNLEEDLKGSSLLSLSGSISDPLRSQNREWDVAVVKGTRADFLEAQNRLKEGTKGAEEKEEGYFITTRDGTPLFALWVDPGDKEAAATIASALEKKARQDNVLALANQVSPFNDKLTVTFIRVIDADKDKEGNPNPREEIRAEDNLGNPVMKVGDAFRLSLKNTADTDLYITVLSVGTSGSITIQYPPNATNEKLKPQAEVKTDILDVGGPAGVENLKFFVSTKPVDFSFLEQVGTLSRSDNQYKDVKSPLEAILLESMGATGSVRDVSKRNPPSVDDWGTSRLEFQIRPKDNSGS